MNDDNKKKQKMKFNTQVFTKNIIWHSQDKNPEYMVLEVHLVAIVLEACLLVTALEVATVIVSTEQLCLELCQLLSALVSKRNQKQLEFLKQENESLMQENESLMQENKILKQETKILKQENECQKGVSNVMLRKVLGFVNKLII